MKHTLLVARFYYIFIFGLLGYSSPIIAAGGTIGLSISAAEQKFTDHPFKINAELLGAQISYSRLDRFTLSLVHRTNDTQFEFPIANNQVLTQELSLTQTGGQVGWHFYTDFLHANWSTELVYHSIKGDLSDPALGDVEIMGGGLKYQNFSKTLFMDAHSYQSNYTQNITAHQWDIGAGISLFKNTTWAQVRQYSVDSPDSKRSEAYELMLQYSPTAKSALLPNSFFASHSFGDRRLFYDPATQSLWNNVDVLKRYTRAGCKWELPKRASVVLVVSNALFRSWTNLSSYASAVTYIELEKRL